MPETGVPGRRSTRQRAAVNDILGELAEFRTAQQLHDELRQQGNSVGLTTVYRTLQALADSGDSVGLTTVYRTLQAMVETGELDAIRTADGETAYRRCSGGHHHHLVCRTCGRTVEVSGPAVEKWATAIAQENGFRDVSHDLEIFGTCANC